MSTARRACSSTSRGTSSARLPASRARGKPHSSRVSTSGSRSAHSPWPSQRVQSTCSRDTAATSQVDGDLGREDVHRAGHEPGGAVGVRHAPRPSTSRASGRPRRRGPASARRRASRVSASAIRGSPLTQGPHCPATWSRGTAPRRRSRPGRSGRGPARRPHRRRRTRRG